MLLPSKSHKNMNELSEKPNRCRGRFSPSGGSRAPLRCPPPDPREEGGALSWRPRWTLDFTSSAKLFLVENFDLQWMRGLNVNANYSGTVNVNLNWLSPPRSLFRMKTAMLCVSLSVWVDAKALTLALAMCDATLAKLADGSLSCRETVLAYVTADNTSVVLSASGLVQRILTVN